MERVFSLDIGTRLVMGLIMEKIKNGYHILASAKTEHQQRAMYDGQVHDIEAVAQAVERVKSQLEQKVKTPLRRVSLAAAGRTLKTVSATSRRSELVPLTWERDQILALEMEAVQKALQELKTEEENAPYHCVGYSIVENLLDGQKILNLVGQRGKDVQITVIATFLPRIVIDGLLGVLNQVGLEMEDLTLEPIAAGEAAIPQEMRRMNLALVDVGAGTADIALSREGSFFAYAMVPMAGDEITEKICQHYFLDFQTGEKVKRSLGAKGKTIKVNDFLGQTITVVREEANQLIQETVMGLAGKIAQEILRVNQVKPQGVILIGGGSQTPLLADYLADILEMPKSRVGLQVRERLTDVHGEKSVKGPDAITPIGIGISALEDRGLHYFSVSVNDKKISLFELQLATVSDALVAAGISPRLLLARPGAALTYELNGEIKVLKGSFGKPAQIHLNGLPVGLDCQLKPDDQITFSPAIAGEAPRAEVGEVIEFDPPKDIIVNGAPLLFSPRVLCNGSPVEKQLILSDGCKIDYLPNRTINDLLGFLNLSQEENPLLRIRVNGKDEQFGFRRYLFVNNEPVDRDYRVSAGDEVIIKDEKLQIGDLGLKAEPMRFRFNDKEVTYPVQKLKIACRGQVLSAQDQVEDGMELWVEGYERMPIISELLPYVDLPEKKDSGSKLAIQINHQPGQFTSNLHPGDRIEIQWVH